MEEERTYHNYTEWLAQRWSDTLDPMKAQIDTSDWKINGEDNSIEIATQQTVEQKMPEFYNEPKKLFIIEV